MSDTGAPAALTSLRISNPILADVAAFVGEIARPFAIIIISIGSYRAIVIVANKVSTGEGAAMFIGAVLAGLGALYFGKAWEKVTQIREGSAK